ncbi:MAG: hypothetical protein ACRCSG_05995 [Cellulosilyticaceae bacterium]
MEVGIFIAKYILTLKKCGFNLELGVFDENYEIEDVIIDGVSVGAVTEYMFTNITSMPTIEVIFRKIKETDVTPSHWAYDAIIFTFK